jgi:hypothetical protein
LIKKLLLFILFAALVGVTIGVYEWNKPAKKAEDVKGIQITALALSKAYSTNEKAADALYLNKVIEVSGTVGEVDKNEDGGTMIVLQTDDPATGIQCALRDKAATATKGQAIIIKGFCSGNGITGVSLTSCVIKQ